VEWFLADRVLDGRAGELARFGLLWFEGGLVYAAPPDRISLAGAAAYEEGGGGNLVPTGGYRMLLERLSAGLDVRLGAPVSRMSTVAPR
jgi:flavin-dependent amine oxidoreductase